MRKLVKIFGWSGAIALKDFLRVAELAVGIAFLTVQPVLAAENVGANQPSPLRKGMATNLIAQGVTRVTGVEVNQTPDGLELILKTVAGSERLVPLILPEGNDLVIDILDATLAFSIRNGVTETNPAPGISRIAVNRVDDSSIRVTITGENQTPSAEVVPGRDDLVLSIAPEGATTEQEPDEEIEVIATEEAEEDGYVVDDATTATRTDTPLQDIPQSIQIVPQQVIEDQQVTDLQETTRNVSGVVQGNTFGASEDRFIIRGFEQRVFLRDGFRDSTGRVRETTNLERVEVLKGPASVLYGTLEPGGIINSVTKKPQADSLYSAELTVGSFSFVEPSLDFSGPLNESETVLYRLNALYESSDVFRDFDQGVERFFVAPNLTWKIGDRTDITFNFEYLDDERPFDRGIVAVGEEIADIPFDRVLGEPDDVSEAESVDTGYLLEHRFSENWKLRNNFRFNSLDTSDVFTDSGSLDESTGILTRGFSNLESLDETYALQTNVVGEFATGSIEHTLLFGIDLFRETQDLNNRFSGNDVAASIDIFNPEYGVVPRPERDELPITANIDNQTDTLGIYLQDQIKLSEQWQLLAGGRFDIIDQESDTNIFGEITDSEQQEEAFSPRIGIVYQPIEPLSLYASFTQSFTPNEDVDAEGELLEPEQGEQFEVGIKGDFLDGDLSATLAAYNINKTNIAIADPDLEGASIPIGEQRSRGIELDVRGEILPGWNIITSYAYTDAETTEDDDSEIEGNRISGVPENAASLWTTYEIQRGSLQGLGFGAGLFFVGDREGDTDNSFQVPSYTRTDASIFYERNSWRAAVNFKNLFDIDYIESASRRTRINPGIPFTVLGSVSVEF